MKTIELTENVKKVTIEYKDGKIEEVNNNPMPFVPKEIGIHDCGGLIFNSSKSVLEAYGSFYDVYSNSSKARENTNNGKSHTYEKTTFGELENGDIWVIEYCMGSKDLIDYNLKINSNEFVYVVDDKWVNGESQFKQAEVYKIVKV